MLDLYIKMIKYYKLMTIDDVPSIWKKQVENALL